MKERRKFNRYQAQYPAEEAIQNRKRSFSMVNVGNGGAAFTATGEVSKDEKITLKIYLRNRMFTLDMVVVYEKPSKGEMHNIGGKFLSVPKEFREAFSREIEEIQNLQKEQLRYKKKILSFKEASIKYLKKNV